MLDVMGPSIYNVHTERGSSSGGRIRPQCSILVRYNALWRWRRTIDNIPHRHSIRDSQLVDTMICVLFSIVFDRVKWARYREFAGKPILCNFCNLFQNFQPFEVNEEYVQKLPNFTSIAYYATRGTTIPTPPIHNIEFCFFTPPYTLLLAWRASISLKNYTAIRS